MYGQLLPNLRCQLVHLAACASVLGKQPRVLAVKLQLPEVRRDPSMCGRKIHLEISTTMTGRVLMTSACRRCPSSPFSPPVPDSIVTHIHTYHETFPNPSPTPDAPFGGTLGATQRPDPASFGFRRSPLPSIFSVVCGLQEAQWPPSRRRRASARFPGPCGKRGSADPSTSLWVLQRGSKPGARDDPHGLPRRYVRR